MFSSEMAGMESRNWDVSSKLSSQPCLELVGGKHTSADVNNGLCAARALFQALRHNLCRQAHFNF